MSVNSTFLYQTGLLPLFGFLKHQTKKICVPRVHGYGSELDLLNTVILETTKKIHICLAAVKQLALFYPLFHNLHICFR